MSLGRMMTKTRISEVDINLRQRKTEMNKNTNR